MESSICEYYPEFVPGVRIPWPKRSSLNNFRLPLYTSRSSHSFIWRSLLTCLTKTFCFFLAYQRLDSLSPFSWSAGCSRRGARGREGRRMWKTIISISRTSMYNSAPVFVLLAWTNTFFYRLNPVETSLKRTRNLYHWLKPYLIRQYRLFRCSVRYPCIGSVYLAAISHSWNLSSRLRLSFLQALSDTRTV